MKSLITVVSATLLSAAAFAGGDKTVATFDALDKNADQQVSKTEAAADKHVSEWFSKADTNGDGYLSKSEFLSKEKMKEKPST